VKALSFRLAVALAVALVAAAVSARAQLSDLALVIDLERQVLSGQQLTDRGYLVPPLFNRVLFPFLYVQAARLLPGFDPGHLFVALRFAVIFACFALIFSSIDRRAARAGVDPVATFLAVGFAYTATVIRHPMPHTSDIIDLALMFYVFLNLVEGRTGIALALACATAVNRESGAFAGIAYVLLRAGSERPVRLLANGALLAIVPYALAIAVRRFVHQGDLPANTTGQLLVGLPSNLRDMLTDFLRFNPWNDFYLLVAMVAFAVLVFARRPAPAAFRWRIAGATVAIALASLEFGEVREIRIFLPCLALLAAAAVADPGAAQRSRGVSSA